MTRKLSVPPPTGVRPEKSTCALFCCSAPSKLSSILCLSPRIPVSRRFPVLPYDRPAASWHARERARLSSVGRRPAFADGQVAAVAVTHDLRLVTRNVDDFADFADLAVENWFR